MSERFLHGDFMGAKKRIDWSLGELKKRVDRIFARCFLNDALCFGSEADKEQRLWGSWSMLRAMITGMSPSKSRLCRHANVSRSRKLEGTSIISSSYYSYTYYSSPRIEAYPTPPATHHAR